MTAEVSVNNYINHSIVRGTGDSGNSFLNQTPKLLATKEGRLNTYKNWPNKNIDPEKLAAAGFFYSGRADVVQCFRCGIKGHNWLVNDKPMEDHKKWNRNCPFLRENVTEQNDAPQTRTGRDYCGNFGADTSQYTESEESQHYYRNLGEAILPFLKPSNTDQIIFENRLATFANWPKSLKQKPIELAAAGFYYLGIGDQTSCFSCGGGLKDWVEQDDPWEQHALWFPQCNYLLLKKTPAFVKSVQAKHKSNLSAKQTEIEQEASCSTSNNSKESPSETVEERQKTAEESSPICKICYENQSNVLLLPCRHIIGCADCASKLTRCAVCRVEIEDNFPVFYT